MIKRQMLLLAAAGMLVLSACGNKKVETETTAESSAEETTETSEEAGSGDETAASAESGADAETADANSVDTDLFEDEGYFDGTVTGMSGTQVTVTSDDGKTYSFDIADAEQDPDYEVLPGAYIEVSYDGAKQEGGVTKATMVAVLMSLEQQAQEKGQDPALQGSIKEVGDGTLTVTDPNGVDHSFDSRIAQIVSKSGLSAGAQVMVTYVGSIDEEAQEDSEDGEGSGVPVAIKVVTPDSVGVQTENKMSGTVSYVDGGHMMIDTAAIPFEFTGDESLFAGLAEGDSVTVTYTGSVGNKTVQATAVTKN